MSGIGKFLYYELGADKGRFLVHDVKLIFNPDGLLVPVLESKQEYAAESKYVGHAVVEVGYIAHFFEMQQYDPEQSVPRSRVLCVKVPLKPNRPLSAIPINVPFPACEVLDYSEDQSAALATDLQIQVVRLPDYLRPLYQYAYNSIAQKKPLQPAAAAAAANVADVANAATSTTTAAAATTAEDKKTPQVDSHRISAGLDFTPADFAAVAGTVVAKSTVEAAPVKPMEDLLEPAQQAPLSPAKSVVAAQPKQAPVKKTPIITRPTQSPKSLLSTRPLPPSAPPSSVATTEQLQIKAALMELDNEIKFFDPDAPESFIKAVAKICNVSTEVKKVALTRLGNLHFTQLLACILDVKSQPIEDAQLLEGMYLAIFRAFLGAAGKDANKQSLDAASTSTTWTNLVAARYIQGNPELYMRIRSFCDAQQARAASRKATVAAPKTPPSHLPPAPPPSNPPAAATVLAVDSTAVAVKQVADTKPPRQTIRTAAPKENIDKVLKEEAAVTMRLEIERALKAAREEQQQAAQPAVDSTVAAVKQVAATANTVLSEFTRIDAILTNEPQQPTPEQLQQVLADLKRIQQKDAATLTDLLRAHNNSNKQTLLMKTLWLKNQDEQHLELARFLIANSGAALYAKDRLGNNALIYAVSRDLSDVGEWERQTTKLAKEPNNKIILDLLLDKFINIPPELKSPIGAAAIEYHAIKELLLNERYDFFIPRAFRTVSLFPAEIQIKGLYQIYALRYVLRTLMQVPVDGMQMSTNAAILSTTASDGNIFCSVENLYLALSGSTEPKNIYPNQKPEALNVCTAIHADLVQFFRSLLRRVSEALRQKIDIENFGDLVDFFGFRSAFNHLKELLNSVDANETPEARAKNEVILKQINYLLQERTKLRSDLPLEAYPLVASHDICALLLFADAEQREGLLGRWIILERQAHVDEFLSNIMPEVFKYLYFGAQYTSSPKCSIESILNLLQLFPTRLHESHHKPYWNTMFYKATGEFLRYIDMVPMGPIYQRDALQLLKALSSKCDIYMLLPNGMSLLDNIMFDIETVFIEKTLSDKEFSSRFIAALNIITILTEASGGTNVGFTKNIIGITAAKIYFIADNYDVKDPKTLKHVENVASFYKRMATAVDPNPIFMDAANNNLFHRLFAELNLLINDQATVNEERIKKLLAPMLDKKKIEHIEAALTRRNADNQLPLDLISNEDVKKRIESFLHKAYNIDLTSGASHKP